MSPRRWRRTILVRRPCVKYVFVGQELDIADIKDHVQRQPAPRLLEDVGGFALGGREGRDEPFIGESGEGTDEVGIPSCKFNC